MKSDRFLKIVLTVIALELGWIAVTRVAEPVSAQAQQAPTRVVITGVELNGRNFIPVAIAGGVEASLSPAVVRVENQQPVRVTLSTPLAVRVEPGDRPIRVESVPFTAKDRPGQ
jgi:hypothetical protein